MTRQQTKVLMPVLVAWSEGRDIEVRNKCHTSNNGWETYREGEPDALPDFENEHLEWRVKPTPREFWVALPKNGGASVGVYTEPPINDKRFNIIHVREVVE